MRRALVWIAIVSSVGCSRPAAPPADNSPATTPATKPAPPALTPEPAVLLTPEASEGAKPQRLDATRPPPRPGQQPYAWDKTNPERIPELPIRKPTRIVGDTRLLVRDGSAAIAASPDGKWLVCGISVFDLKTGRENFQLHTHGVGQTSRLVFTGETKLLFTGGQGGYVAVWDLVAKERILQLHATDWALTPDGTRLASIESVRVDPPPGAGERGMKLILRPVVRIRDTKTWKETSKFAVNGFRPTAIAISPDGGAVALGGADGTIRTWGIKSGKELEKLGELSDDPDKPAVVKIAFRADGKQLAASNGVRSVAVWDWPDGKLRHRWAIGNRDLADLRFAPDGKHLVAAGPGTVWNLATGKVEAQLDYNRDKRSLTSFDFAPGGESLFVRTNSPRPQSWAFPSLKPLPLLDPAIADTPVKLPFETVGDFGGIKEVKLRDGTTLRTGLTKRRNSSDWGVEHFDADGEFVRCIDKTRVVGFDVSPDQKRIACYGHRSDGQGREFPLIFWDIATGKEVSRINEYPRPDYWLRYSPDGKWLATMHEDGLVRVWDVAARKPVFALDTDRYGAPQLLFSKDGRYLIGGSEKAVILVVWDLRDSDK